MKKILIFIVPIFLLSNQKLIDILKDEKILQVCNVSKSDRLNVRTKPTVRSKIITEIPYNSIFRNKSCTLQKKKITDRWQCIQYYDFLTHKYYNGWINRKYISLIKTWKEYKTKNITIYYPAFLTLKNNCKFNLSKKTQYRYKQYKDGRDGIIERNEIYDFDMTLKLYESFQEALKENYLIDGYDFNKSSYETGDPIQKIKNGYSVRTGNEGVGEIYFIQIKHNKSLVGILKYNINNITPLQKTKPFLIRYQESIELAKQIMLKTIIR